MSRACRGSRKQASCNDADAGVIRDWVSQQLPPWRHPHRPLLLRYQHANESAAVVRVIIQSVRRAISQQPAIYCTLLYKRHVTQKSQDPLLLRAVRGDKVERPPVWMMRQAGRYMKVLCMLEFCQTTAIHPERLRLLSTLLFAGVPGFVQKTPNISGEVRKRRFGGELFIWYISGTAGLPC